VGNFDGFDRLICVPILHRNSPLPASKAEMFYTVYDNQAEVDVTAYQGEAPIPEQNVEIGRFLVKGLSRVPAGNPVVIKFELDLNGMLKVTALEKSTGLAKSVVMDTRGRGVTQLDEAKRNVAALLEQVDKFSRTEQLPDQPQQTAPGETTADSPENLLTTAKDLRKRGEVLLEKNISPDDAEEIRRLIHECAGAIKERHWSDLAKRTEALSDLLFYLED
jgi:molecular chaperone DnaK